jgi:hypothetical protein
VARHQEDDTVTIKELHEYASGEHVPLSVDAGCDSCGTCPRCDGCADDLNPVDLQRGDCAECGACGLCVADCAKAREAEASP